MSTFKNIYATIKVTLSCNLSCLYCYGRDNHAIGRQMTDTEIKSAIDFILKYTEEVKANSITICWHGGEPFLFIHKLPFFIEYANEIFSVKGFLIRHVIQTNATLLEPETFPIIKKYFDGFVGVSVDLFSKYRVFRSGVVSTDMAVRKIDNAIANGIKCGAINLLTKDNKNSIKQIYDFYKSRNMSVRLSRVFPIAKDFDTTSPMYLSDEEFADAKIEYFDIWAHDPQPAHNSDIVKLIGDLLLGKPSICLRESACHLRYLALSPGGEIYSCAEFDVPESIIGNFQTQTPHEFIASSARQKLSEKAAIPKSCESCKFYETCHGGCFRERFMIGFPWRCKSDKLYWEHIIKWLNKKGANLYMLRDKTPQQSREIIRKIFEKQ